jgi:kinesin family protein 5
LIVNCSPSSYNEDETISTLRFGIRAKTIKNKPKINQELSAKELMKLLEQAKVRISSLEVELKKFKGGTAPSQVIETTGTDVSEKIQALEQLLEQEKIEKKEMMRKLDRFEEKEMQIVEEYSKMRLETENLTKSLENFEKGLEEKTFESDSLRERSKEMTKELSESKAELLKYKAMAEKYKAKESIMNLYDFVEKPSEVKNKRLALVLEQLKKDLSQIDEQDLMDSESTEKITKEIQGGLVHAIANSTETEESQQDSNTRALLEKIQKLEAERAQERKKHEEEMDKRLDSIYNLELAMNKMREAYDELSMSDTQTQITKLHMQIKAQEIKIKHRDTGFSEYVSKSSTQVAEHMNKIQELERFITKMKVEIKDLKGSNSTQDRNRRLTQAHIHTPLRGGTKFVPSPQSSPRNSNQSSPNKFFGFQGIGKLFGFASTSDNDITANDFENVDISQVHDE